MATIAWQPLGAAYRIPSGATVYTAPAGYPNATTEALDLGMPPACLVNVRRLVVTTRTINEKTAPAEHSYVVRLAANGIAYAGGAEAEVGEFLALVNSTAAVLNYSLTIGAWGTLTSLDDLVSKYGWTKATVD